MPPHSPTAPNLGLGFFVPLTHDAEDAIQVGHGWDADGTAPIFGLGMEEAELPEEGPLVAPSSSALEHLGPPSAPKIETRQLSHSFVAKPFELGSGGPIYVTGTGEPPSLLEGVNPTEGSDITPDIQSHINEGHRRQLASPEADPQGTEPSPSTEAAPPENSASMDMQTVTPKVPALFSPVPTMALNAPEGGPFIPSSLPSSPNLNRLASTSSPRPAPSPALFAPGSFPETSPGPASVSISAGPDYLLLVVVLSVVLGVLAVGMCGFAGFLFWRKDKRPSDSPVGNGAPLTDKPGGQDSPMRFVVKMAPRQPTIGSSDAFTACSPSLSDASSSFDTKFKPDSPKTFAPPNEHHFRSPSPAAPPNLKLNYINRPPPLVIIPKLDKRPSSRSTYPPPVFSNRTSVLVSPSLSNVPLSAVGGWSRENRRANSQGDQWDSASSYMGLSPISAMSPVGPFSMGNATALPSPTRSNSDTLQPGLLNHIPNPRIIPDSRPISSSEIPPPSAGLVSKSSMPEEMPISKGPESIFSQSSDVSSTLSFKLVETMERAIAARAIAIQPSEGGTRSPPEPEQANQTIAMAEPSSELEPLAAPMRRTDSLHSISTMSGHIFDVVREAPFIVIKCPPDDDVLEARSTPQPHIFPLNEPHYKKEGSYAGFGESGSAARLNDGVVFLETIDHGTVPGEIAISSDLSKVKYPDGCDPGPSPPPSPLLTAFQDDALLGRSGSSASDKSSASATAL